MPGSLFGMSQHLPGGRIFLTIPGLWHIAVECRGVPWSAAVECCRGVLPWSAADYNYLAKGSLGIATALTLYSGLQYGAVAFKSRKQA